MSANSKMNNVEHIIELENILLKYKIKKGSQDRKHLLVIFSGFGGGKLGTYDFSGSVLSGCRSNILWIKDDFDGKCTYYLCQAMDFSIEKAVITLIDRILNSLNLSRKQCTLLGGSKGGSAAIYYGVKYDFDKIIASCPQINIGTYTVNNWQSAALKMQQDITNEKKKYLDSLIPTLLSSDKNKNRNIYLISSPDDIQYKNEISPFLHYFDKYNNFNFVFTRSALAYQHSKVTRYNIPIILSIVYAHGEGINPSFGRVSNGIPRSGWDLSPTLIKQQQQPTLINFLSNFRIDGDVFFPEGVALIKGYPCYDYGVLKRKIIFEGKNTYEFNIGAIKNKNISYEFFDEVYCDYEATGFATLKHAGIDLSKLECGVYIVKISASYKKISITNNLNSRAISLKSCSGQYEYHITNDGEKVKLIKQPIISDFKPSIFELKESWFKNNLLHVEGIFIVPGIEVANWGDSIFYFILKNGNSTFSFKIGACNNPELNEKLNGYSIYQKCYFSSIKKKGVNIQNLPKGEYSSYISMSYKSFIFTHELNETIRI
ncbi:MAG: hypothetical protein ACRCZT_01750 [Plesiomonas sp.]